MTPLQLRALDFIREHVSALGFSPTLKEIAEHCQIAPGGAPDLVRGLEQGGFIRRNSGKNRNIEVVGQIDLRTVETDALRAELARRGFTLDSLVERPMLADRGAPCAHDRCDQRVSRGKLFCRPHWFAIPQDVRDAIFRAHRAGDVHAYGDNIERARQAIREGGGR